MTYRILRRQGKHVVPRQMASFHLALHVLRGVVIGPAFAMVVLMSWAGWWGLEHLLPLGLTTGTTHRLSAHYEVSFIAGGAVAALTAARLARHDVLLRRLRSTTRTATEWATCVCAGTLAAGALVAPAHLLREWQLEQFRGAASFPALTASLGHLSALLVIGLRAPSGDRVAALAAAAAAGLVLPGLLMGDTPASAGVLVLIDTSAPLRRSFDFPADGAHWLRAALPTLGWGLVAAALASPRADRSTLNPPPALPPENLPLEVRDPR